MDKYRIDSHKLIFHPQRVAQWLDGKTIYPIYAEFSPAGSCNHRCTYCGLDFMGYKPAFHKTDIIKTRIAEMGALGLKSIMFAGEGEPFLHKDMVEINNHANQCGVDTSFTTNGVLYTPDKADASLEYISWIKVSINGGTKETHSKIHCTNINDFDRVISNMHYAAQLKAKKGFKCTLGMQMVLLPENAGEMETLAKTAKEIGMSYLVIKPYSQHPQSITDKYKDISYADYIAKAKDLAKLSDENFSFIFRANTMDSWDSGVKGYDRCLALPFWTYVDSSANVWGCSMFLGNDKFKYGNLYENTFEEIWNSEKRKQSLDYVCSMDASACRINCRMEHINRYLWELKHPGDHVNFI